MRSAMRQSEGGETFSENSSLTGEKVRGMDLSPGEQTLVSLRDLTFGASGGQACSGFGRSSAEKIHVVEM